MKQKIIDIIGYILFILFFIIASPLLFLRGGIVGIVRYYKYVSDKVHNKKPNKYYW